MNARNSKSENDPKIRDSRPKIRVLTVWILVYFGFGV